MSKKINVTVDDELFEMIDEAAKATGLSRPMFMALQTRLALGMRTKSHELEIIESLDQYFDKNYAVDEALEKQVRGLKTAINKLAQEEKRLGNNLNQIARHLNRLALNSNDQAMINYLQKQIDHYKAIDRFIKNTTDLRREVESLWQPTTNVDKKAAAEDTTII